VLLSDRAGYNALWGGLELLKLDQAVSLIDLPTDLDVAAVLKSTRPLTHLVALERSGPSHAGRNHTMRGLDVTDLTAPAHRLFEAPRDYVTIGIGDGGNEIGMGKLPHATICKNIPNGETIACRTATDHLIVAGVSNWGAWALAAAVMLLRGNVEPAFFYPALHVRCLGEMVARGPLVDGVTGQRANTVDGLTIEDYLRPQERILATLASGAA
jgi:hypothetical protein